MYYICSENKFDDQLCSVDLHLCFVYAKSKNCHDKAYMFYGSSYTVNYAPNFEIVGGTYCFWSVHAYVHASHFLVPTLTFKPFKLEC